jgi:aarF domain-containing kinase
MSDQWAVVLDDWATRFFEEMDYQREASNTMVFKEQMAALQVREGRWSAGSV